MSSDGILDELPSHIAAKLASYCVHDVELCVGVFERLVEGYPSKELRLIDMTLRMFIDPKLELDQDTLKEALARSGMDTLGGTAQAMSLLLFQEESRWQPIVKSLAIALG
ncbi:MAG: hypothetical protein EBX54_07950 [Betaproteobacteria bacterium]|nr:hypothetical protein [Betaproteobacteria bacterium]